MLEEQELIRRVVVIRKSVRNNIVLSEIFD